MQLLDDRIKPNSNIFLIGDTHEGAKLFDDDGWNAFVEMMHSPYDDCKNNYYVDHGDSIEAIQVDDHRYGIAETAECRTLNQMTSAVERRRKISDMCLAWLMGNHEYKLQKFGDITAKMAAELGVQYGTYSCKLTYRSNRSNSDNILFKHFATHGFGSMQHLAGDEEQRLANMKVKMKRLLRFKASDCYLMSMGHTHRLLTRPPLLKLNMIDDGTKLRQVYDTPLFKFRQGDILHEDMRWYCNTGSFLKTMGIGFSGYAERWGLDPNIIGFNVAIVRDGRLVNVREERI